VDLPGDHDTTSSWETTLDAEAAVPVLATAEVDRMLPLALAGAAALLALVVLLLLVLKLVSAIRRRRRRRRAARRDRRSTPAVVDDGLDADEPDGEGVDAPTEAVRIVPAVAAGPSGDDEAEDETDAVGLALVVVGGPGAAFGV